MRHSMPLPMCEKSIQIIAIAAGKGGVGKSTVTAGLALALCELGHKVGVLDGDLYGPSLRRMLPETSLPGKGEGKLTPANHGGIKLMTMAYFQPDDKAALVRAPIAHGAIGSLVSGVDWGRLDYLLVDFPPGTGDLQMTLCKFLEFTGVVVVTTPQEVALLDVKKAIDAFTKLDVPVIGVVENMSYLQRGDEKIPVFGKGGGVRLASEQGVPLLGQIPLDPMLCQACDQGRLGAEWLINIARRLTDEMAVSSSC